jgi:hypothetical protein
MTDAKPRPKNWLLVKIREWHTWLGVFLSGFVILVCATGIYLNHKDLFRSAAPHDDARGGRPAASGALRTTTSLAELPIPFEHALAQAREQWGETPIEKIELKEEHGRLVYKVMADEGREIRVDVETGAVSRKDAYREEHHGPDGKKEAGFNWGKFMMDLHTGKVIGGPGKLVVDLTSFVIIVLTGTGIYLWAIPQLRKRRSARDREAAARKTQATTVPPPADPARVF